MTERGPIADGAPACPFVAFDDARDDRADRPDPRHRCYAESPPAPRARAHQEAYCLSANFPVCPTFQDWARREAARVTASTAAGSAAERLRDVPAQREAGTRPVTFAAGAAAAGAAGAGEATVPPPSPGTVAGEAMLDRAIVDHVTDDEPAADPAPWDLPPRRSVQPDWTAPPPWSQPRPAARDGAFDPADDGVEPPDFLRPATPSPAPAGVWAETGGLPEADDDLDALPDVMGGAPAADFSDADGPVAERDANMARLRAMGMGQAPSSADDEAGPGPKPVAGVTRSVPPGSSAGGRAAVGVAVDPDDIDVAPTPRPVSTGLARALGWDRRPRAGAKGPTGKADRNPAWERPRRMEAYPTLKTRVGLPIPSRMLLALGAILVAAAILFFVPPLFLKQGGGGASPAATRSPGASGSGAVSSAAGSRAPTAKPTAAGKTYTIKKGDTLLTIAKRFGVSVEAILAANKQIKDPNKIAVGDIINIPAAGSTTVVDGGASP